MLKSQIEQMLVLQDAVNTKTDPDWRTAGHAWHRAIFVETAEFIEHLGWKWWKKQTPDIPQAQIELVDIWHFMLSHKLIRCVDFEGAALSLHCEWNRVERRLYSGDTLRLAEMFAANVVRDRSASAPMFKLLCEAVGLSDDMLYKMYVGKNVLNNFRQDNGYKEGTYVKIWRGHEDNVWLAKAMDEHPDWGVDELRAELTRMYADVLESQSD